jgi:hypothetical protein
MAVRHVNARFDTRVEPNRPSEKDSSLVILM